MTFEVVDAAYTNVVGYYTTDSSDVTELASDSEGNYTITADKTTGNLENITVIAKTETGETAKEVKVSNVTVNAGHTPEKDSTDCTETIKCKFCDENAVVGSKSHKWSDWDFNNDTTDPKHSRNCETAGCKVTETKSCADTDKDHYCDTCKGELSSHSGGTATCKDKAVCDYCEKEYGEKDADNHVGGTEIKDAKAATCTEDGYTGNTHCKGCDAKLSDGKSIPAKGHGMAHIEAVAATDKSEGNNEYWYCEECDKYFADEAGTTEIALADTVIDKLPADKSSATGDDFNVAALIALLIAAGGTFAGTGIYSRRRQVK